MSCETCNELRDLLRRSEEANADLTEQLSGAQTQLRRAGQAETKLRTELAKLREEEPETPVVKALFELWRTSVMNGDKSLKLRMDGPRAKKIRWALKAYGEERCQQAILGVRLDAWAMGRIRKSGGKKFNDIAKHILADEETIERFSKAHREHQAAQRTPGEPGGIEALLPKLEGVKQVSPVEWMARCPAHEDRTPSLKVTNGDGAALVRCYAGCSAEEIVAAVGLRLASLFNNTATSSTQPQAVVLPALPSDEQLRGFVSALLGRPDVVARVAALRGWNLEALRRLAIGLDQRRLIFPVRDRGGHLVNVLRYQPNPAKRVGPERKLFAAKGRPRDLFPAPETIAGDELWLVEGEPDAVSGHELGLPAVGLPGANGFKQQWVPRFEGRKVVVVGDCDDEGRRMTERVARLLVPAAAEVRICDLDPSRSDGYDLGDVLLGGGTAAVLRRLASEGGAVIRLGKEEAA